jgi:oxaloacetate decarboxylase beta subunit
LKNSAYRDNLSSKKPPLRTSILISVAALIIYFGSTFILPASTSAASNGSGDGDEYFFDFDGFNEWEPDYDLASPMSADMIIHTYEQSYEGSSSIKMNISNPVPGDTIWLTQTFKVMEYKNYEVILEFYFIQENGGGSDGELVVFVDTSAAEHGFEFKNIEIETLPSSSWSKARFKTDVSTEDDDELCIAFGLRAVSNMSSSFFIDNFKINIEEPDPTLFDLVVIYGKASIMFVIGGVLIFLAIRKKYEPLLLLPIGIGIILTNIPFVGMMEPGGILRYIYDAGIKTTIFPLLIFLGIGAMTDFGPMLANPKTALLGAAAQFGIFTTLLGALIIGFSVSEASSIGIIGGADGPTAIYLTIRLAPHLLGPIAIAAYSYMALVPIIQPPIINALTTKEERKIKMKQMRFVSQRERILFPIAVIILCAFLIWPATPLVGMLMFGNLLRESRVVERLANAAQNELINVVTIFLGVSVGATMSANTFLTPQTIFIILLGLAAFCVGTATGVIFGKIMCKTTNGQVNPMIGAAGVSAVPMAARVVQAVGRENDPENHLLMHAMGPNVAGVLGSAIAAGVLLWFVGGTGFF